MARAPVILSLLLFAAPALLADLAPETFHGQVLIQSNGPDRIYVYIDSFEQSRGRDGFIDHLFVLAAPALTPTSVLFEQAEINVYPHAVSIHSPRDRAAFVLATRPVDIGFVNGTTSTHFTGEALSHHSGRSATSIASVTRYAGDAYSTACEECDPIYVDPDPYGTGSGTTCNAGGPGATSCSIGCGIGNLSCSVSCSIGYACCKCSFGEPSCKCIR